jgi:hygromycin-B 7''-O-kinase
MRQVHSIDAGALADLPPPWSDFLERQAIGCRARHERLGAPAWLTARVEPFVARGLGQLPATFRPSILTGEYTPFNLLVSRTREGWELSGMIDFGDAMVGFAEYDLHGPSLFLAAGDPDLLAALLRGYGTLLSPALRRRLMVLTLLHRYANLPVQLRLPNWQHRAQSLEALEALIWPLD